MPGDARSDEGNDGAAPYAAYKGDRTITVVQKKAIEKIKVITEVTPHCVMGP
tara:strand:- start:276 stop:431 length:156 start_codon:yes stop_codon:yes gene_type:complete